MASMFGDPLCACSGGSGEPSTCGRQIVFDEEDETTLPLESYSATYAPVSAGSYEPDTSDPIDMELSRHLTSIDHATLSKLTLNRLVPGEYVIDGRHVSIHWGSMGVGPCSGTELLVSEEREDGDWDSLELPLQVYLFQALDVAAFLGGERDSGAPAVLRVPPDMRLSFLNLPEAPVDDPELERVMSMARACKEAQMREKAAEVYERGKLGKDGRIQRHLFRSCSNSLTAESRMPALPEDPLGLAGFGPPEEPLSPTNSRARMPKAPASVYGINFCNASGRPMKGPIPMSKMAPTGMQPARNLAISRNTNGSLAVGTRIRKV